MEEQNATTHAISGHANETARETSGAYAQLEQVDRESSETVTSAQAALAATETLFQMAGELRTRSREFAERIDGLWAE